MTQKRKQFDNDDDPEENKKQKFNNNSVPNRFQRVDVSKTNVRNNKLMDNSYAANAHQYGKRAAEDLGRVKGDRFRHEKTKKKRGSYKGGVITTDVKSIPLDDE